jgi:hypothetical protein
MKAKCACVAWIFFAIGAQSQTDRGTITGTVTDPSGAAAPHASLVVVETASGARYRTKTTERGDYTMPNLPAGAYDLTAEVNGFKKFLQKGINVSVAQTARIDVLLQIGSNTEVVTVAADASLLKTENGEQSTTISRERLNDLPINFASTGAIRDPLAFARLTPGTYQSGNTGIRVNGLPTTSFKITVEGQDTTDGNLNDREDGNHPSVEAMQEFTIQTSNFSAEFGQVGGGLFNFTARSGANQLHAAGYEYFVNEALNAGQPFTSDGNGHLIRPRNRQNDYGFTVGGPWLIPKVYDGRNKTFFFFSWERYSQTNSFIATQTVPTADMRNGNFSGILTGRQLGADILGRPILENTIYDPQTAQTVKGQAVTSPFPGNQIPSFRFDPISAKIQSMIPLPTSSGLVNNYSPIVPVPRRNLIPTVNVDHNFTDRLKASFYWSELSIFTQASIDGLPVPLTARRDLYTYGDTYRLNADYSITPTLYFHAGIGYIRTNNPDSSPAPVTQYDAQGQLGLRNVLGLGFPHIGGISSSFGGLTNGFNGNGLGPTQRNDYWTDKATAVSSLTWVRGAHTYKTGAEYKRDLWSVHTSANVAGGYNFSGSETGLPYLATTSVSGGSIGFPWASWGASSHS